jgi:hypothetical protein
VGAPFPARHFLPHPVPGHSLAAGPTSAPRVAGLGTTHENCGRSGGRSRPGPGPFWTSPWRPGARSTGCGAVLEPLRNGLDQQARDLNRTPAAACPDPADHDGEPPQASPMITGQGVGPDHRKVRTHPAATGSSRTGLGPRRGRPPTQPRYSAVAPTRPPRRRAGAAEPGRLRRRPGPECGAVVTSRERRAHRRFHHHVDVRGVPPNPPQVYVIMKRAAMISESGARAADRTCCRIGHGLRRRPCVDHGHMVVSRSSTTTIRP